MVQPVKLPRGLIACSNGLGYLAPPENNPTPGPVDGPWLAYSRSKKRLVAGHDAARAVQPNAGAGKIRMLRLHSWSTSASNASIIPSKRFCGHVSKEKLAGTSPDSPLWFRAANSRWREKEASRKVYYNLTLSLCMDEVALIGSR